MSKGFTSIVCHLFLIACVVMAAACQKDKKASTEPAAKWVLLEPSSFDLKIPPHFFRGQLQGDPELDECHTQGMEIVDDTIYVSCCLYNPRQKMRRSYASDSFILKASLSEVLDKKRLPPIQWTAYKLTEIAPEQEQKRISESFINNLPAMLGTFMNWFLPLDDFEHVMGHPSGILYDEKQGGLWVANAVYSWDSYTHLHLLNPVTLEPVNGQRPIAVKEHLGFVAPSKGDFLWSFNWGNSPLMILIDPHTRRIRKVKRPVPPSIAYQDCDQLDQSTILCAGGKRLPESWYPQQNGILHMLKTYGADFDSMEVRHTETLVWNPDLAKKTSSKFGSRSFVSIETLGDIEMAGLNYYGDHETPLPLTNAGMAIGPNKRYIYFIPDDLPAAKLIRFELKNVLTDLK